jgi:hypothetical protein
MPDLPRLEADDGGTLTFDGARQDDRSERANPNLYNDPSDPRPPQIHVDIREAEYQLQGQLSAPRLARRAEYSDDWRTALAEWVVEYEAFCTQFQGAGYTFVDPLRDVSTPVVMDSAEWTLTAGAPYEITFQASLIEGEGVLETRTRDPKAATPDAATSGAPAAVLDGIDLPGFESMRVAREFSTEVNARAYTGIDTAAKNEIVVDEGVTHRVEYEGQKPGDYAARQAFDDSLDALVGTSEVVFDTAFPGYAIDGVVLGYEPEYRAQSGTDLHTYRVDFLEGTRLS